MEADSTFFDGTQAWGTPVRVELNAGWLEIHNQAGDLVVRWEAAQLSRLKTREEKGAFYLTRGGAAHLILRNALVQAQLETPVVAKGGEFLAAVPRDVRIGVAAVVCAVAIGTFFWTGAPFLTRSVVALMPTSLDKKLGKYAFASFAKERKVCDNKEGLAALKKLKAHTLSEPMLSYRIIVLKDKNKNAIAFPGGDIIFFSGFLDSVHAPEALAGVLAHEAGHIFYRHAMEELISLASIGVISALVLGDTTALTLLAVEVGTSRHTQGREKEADAFAHKLMKERAIDPKPLVRWFEKLAAVEGEGILDYVSTHPRSQARADLLQQIDAYPTRKILTAQEWVALKNICS